MNRSQSIHNDITATDACIRPAISVNGLSRRYHIVERQPSRLIPIGLVNRLFLSFSEKPFWALRDIDLTLEHGKMFGIFGDNGSGKSTLLKIIAGIVQPTEGKIDVNGRVAPLLELGTGFHPDLSGMENIFLNGTILGLKHQEIHAQLDKIIAFADIGEYLYTPVRFYSSGMKARLGFAVAAHLDCDIYLIDEILGVGDIHFRAKSFNMITQLRERGKTILLVSHNLEPLKRFCDEVIWLDDGKIVEQGDPETIADAYLARCLRTAGRKSSLAQSFGLGPDAVITERERGSIIKSFKIKESCLGEYGKTNDGKAVVSAEALGQTRVVLETELQLPEKSLPNAQFGVAVMLNGRQLIAEAPPHEATQKARQEAGIDLSDATGSRTLEVLIEPIPLLNHTFQFYGCVFNAMDRSIVYDVSPEPVVLKGPDKGKTFSAFTWDAPAQWSLEKADEK